MSDPLTRLRVNRPARHTVMNVRTASRGGQVTGREIASTAWRPWPFWTIAATLFLFLFGAGAPSPLYVVYQQRFGFSATTLTAIFAVYSLALLVTMIPAGTLSDQIGRRPVILGAIALQAVAMVLFLLADGTAMLFAARIVQGAASGAALGTLNAALVDFQPVGSARGPLIGSLAQTIGLALGAVGAGALVQLGVAPLRLVYWVQFAALALAAVVILLAVPETIIASATRVRLQFRARVPLEARHPFTALAPGLIAGWALTGLFLSLGPSLALVLLHSHSHVIGGLLPATFFFLSAPAAVATRNWSGRLAVLSGTLLLAAGALVTLAGIRTSSPVLLFGGSAVVGVGFGPAFVGTLRTLAPLASPSARGGLFAAVFVVSYLALPSQPSSPAWRPRVGGCATAPVAAPSSWCYSRSQPQPSPRGLLGHPEQSARLGDTERSSRDVHVTASGGGCRGMNRQRCRLRRDLLCERHEHLGRDADFAALRGKQGGRRLRGQQRRACCALGEEAD